MDTEGRALDLNHRFEVDGQVYTITLFTPTKAIRLLARLTKLTGETMAVMAAANGENVLHLLPHAARVLLEKMDEDEVVNLIKELCTSVSKERKMISFDLEFHGRLGTMMKLLAKIVEVQFTDFYKALGDSFRGGMKDLSA